MAINRDAAAEALNATMNSMVKRIAAIDELVKTTRAAQPEQGALEAQILAVTRDPSLARRVARAIRHGEEEAYGDIDNAGEALAQARDELIDVLRGL